MFRGSVKGTGYPLHSPVSPSLPLPCVTVCHHISTGVYKMGTRSFLEVKRPGYAVDHPPSSSEVKERVQLYIYSPLGLRGLFQGCLYLVPLPLSTRKVTWWGMKYECGVLWNVTGKKRSTSLGRKCHPSANLSTTYPRTTAIGLNPDLMNERPATSCLSMSLEWYVKCTQKNLGCVW